MPSPTSVRRAPARTVAEQLAQEGMDVAGLPSEEEITGEGAKALLRNMQEIADIATGKVMAFIPEGDGAQRENTLVHLAYWRICNRMTCARHRARRNHIIIGPSHIGQFGPAVCQEFADALHATSLELQYGAEPIRDTALGGMRSGQWDANRPFGPWEHLMRQPGGFYEFPAEQAVELFWEGHPELLLKREDTAKLYNSMKICQVCPNRRFLTKAALDAHMADVHSAQAQAALSGAAIGTELREALIANKAELTETMAGMFQMFVETNRQNMEALAAMFMAQGKGQT